MGVDPNISLPSRETEAPEGMELTTIVPTSLSSAASTGKDLSGSGSTVFTQGLKPSFTTRISYSLPTGTFSIAVGVGASNGLPSKETEAPEGMELTTIVPTDAGGGIGFTGSFSLGGFTLSSTLISETPSSFAGRCVLCIQ